MKDPRDIRLEALMDMWDQCSANEERWAHLKRTPSEYMVIAMEELGEVARAMQGDGGEYQWPPVYSERVYEELQDLGAVVLAMMVEVRRQTCP